MLLVSNMLGLWGGLFSHHILILPWLALYCALALFLLSLLLYLLVILSNLWFKILLFLVIAPIIVISFAFWVVVLRLYSSIRRGDKRGGVGPLRPHR